MSNIRIVTVLAVAGILAAGGCSRSVKRENASLKTQNSELATNLSTMIQALIILFVGAELLIVYAWNARKKVGFGGPTATPRVKAQEL